MIESRQLVADILLAHSYHLAYDPMQVWKMRPYPPLGTLHAAAALRAQRIPAAVFDAKLQDPISGCANMLPQRKPKILAIFGGPHG
jgi:anaerobic magnesium-protoporphyrin IX monomethyl ester cyclase